MKGIAIIIFLMMAFNSRADHIIGGDIYYDDLGGGNYKFYITIYRDCNAEGAWFDDPLKLSVYNNNSLIENVNVFFPGYITLPIDFDNPCATAPTDVCVQRAIYEKTIFLPPVVGGYTVSYQRCCRGPNVTNIVNPDDTGLTLTTHIPGSETGITNNSSPRFSNYPPTLLCVGQELVFDHSATDPDGDELVYTLVSPYTGASSLDPAPNQSPPPPYFPVQWLGGFNAASPLGPGSTSSIDANGMFTVNPSIIGLMVVGVRVQEYRNGQLIGETIRDFLFKVFDCNITMQAILPTQEELSSFISFCQGLTVDFENNSYGGTNYSWDFGVPGTNTDVSSSFTPFFTYPSPGSYIAQLIVNPGWDCTDTAYIEITVNNTFSLSWEAEDSLCITGNNFEFNGVSSNLSANFQWQLDPDASLENFNGIDIPNISFSSSGYHTIILNGDDGDCNTFFEDSVFVVEQAVVDILLPDEIECLGLTIDFSGAYANVNSILWNFGNNGSNSDQSTSFNPNYTYLSPGTYTVQLIGESVENCSDTTTTEITLNEPISLAFTNNDSLCITDGLYDFEALVSGPPNALYEWDFGPNASTTTSADLIISGIQFDTPGFQEVQLTGTHENCVDSISALIYVFAEPTIDFDFIDGLHCAPSLAQFVNLSSVDGPAIYSWDFGDGSGSEYFSPTHVYTDVGSYSVGLTVISLEGCVDTLYLMQQDVFTVYPSPIAGFQVNPQNIDVCDNKVDFIDQSIGATNYFYFFDQNQFTSPESSFSHNYLNAGSDYPLQVVYNEFGCNDSIRQEVFVEPFVLYVPNTFIPDADGINDVFNAVTDFEILRWELAIYNRWGELVFKTENFQLGWGGTFNGLQSQDGLYSYVIKYRSCANPFVTEMKSGFVNLIR